MNQARPIPSPPGFEARPEGRTYPQRRDAEAAIWAEVRR